MDATRPHSTARWWSAVLVGILVSLPLSWLLSYGALLPFFIGLFFFALFGVVIGASVYRVGAPARPIGMGALVVGTTLVVAVSWGLSMIKESRDFPDDIADIAIRRAREIGDRSAGEYKAYVADAVRRMVKEKFPPGGTFGYVRWSLMDGSVEAGRIEGVTQVITRPQRRIGFAIRVVLSIALLGFGVGSQTFLLRTAESSRQDQKTSGW